MIIYRTSRRSTMRIAVGVAASDRSTAARTRRRRTTPAVRSWRRTLIACTVAYVLGVTTLLVIRPVDLTVGLHVVPREISRTTCVAPASHSQDGASVADNSSPEAAEAPAGSVVATRPSDGAE
jgi:hypothetical protein